MSAGPAGDPPGRDSAPRLTDEQRRPLDVRGASVALSAGAGCGKTTVLTSRFLGALDGQNPLGAIVALTFTEKAARELRGRIREECRNRLRAGGGDVAYWRSVLRGLEAAPISTFHEYSAGLLRRHALRAGIDPDFEILDEAIAGSVLDDALARRVRRWLAEENEDLVELSVEFGLRRVREGLERLVRGRDAGELAAWEGRTAEELVEVWRAAWEAEGRGALVGGFLRAGADCVTLLTAHECRHPKMAERVRAVLEAFEALPTAADPSIFLDLIAENAKVQGGGKAEHWPSAEVFERVKARLAKLRDAVKSLRPKLQVDEDATLRAAELGLRFVRLAAEGRRAYDEAKRARGGLDFDDLIVKTRDLLRAHPDAGAHGIEFVLVDEFQDTDPVQAEILRRLSGEGFAAGRLFVVGDFKQSIYRFRGAAPRIFRDFRAEFPVEGRHALTENFRSSVGVVDFVNALFTEAFEGEAPRLTPGPHAAPAGPGPAVEFVWADETADDDEDEGAKKPRPDVDARRRVEARWLARLVRARLAEGWPVRDRKTKQVRPAHPGDVAFLFRAMTDLAAYEQALEAEGFDYHVVGGKAFYAQHEVRDLINVLSSVEDPFDPVSLAGALRGPFFGLSDEALFWLNNAGRGDLADGLENADVVAELSPADRARALRARERLGRWRALKDRLPIAGLVDRVLDESGFEAALLGEPLGGRKRANARKLVRLARRFDARGGFTLAHFVARLRADLREPPREEQAATTEEEGTSVRLLSIHQSKGLEFPIVVVPDLNRKQDLSRGAVAFHPALGPLVRPGKEEGADDADEEGSGRPLGLVTYEAVERREDDEEAVRLFYVATTRARDALVLSAGAAFDAKPDSSAMRLLDARFDRRTGACLATLPEGWNAPAVRVTTECPPPPAPATPQSRKPRLASRAAAKLIRSAPQRDGRPGVDGFVPPAPRFVDLDAARGLSPRAARLDRLIRSILADPRLTTVRDPQAALAAAARRAARRQDPVARDDLRDEAVALLAPWLTGKFGTDLASSASLERGAEWTVSWPSTGDDATVFRGTTEFFARDASGSCFAITFSTPGAPDPVERLRLLLSARAAEGLGFGPVVRGWRVRLGDGLHGEESFDDATLASAVRAAFKALKADPTSR